MSSAGSIVWDMSDMVGKTAAMSPQIRRGLRAITDRVAVQSQDYMRLNAKWTDRTGNARGGLFAKAIRSAEQTDDVYAVVLYHTVDYGIWLEVRWSGALGVIPDAVQVNGATAMRLVSKLLDRLDGVA